MRPRPNISARNTARARRFELRGRSLTISEIADLSGRTVKNIGFRIRRGLTAEQAAFGLSGNQLDITNECFGTLVAVAPIRKSKSGTWWLCKCAEDRGGCGKTREFNAGQLPSRKSCGCKGREKASLQARRLSAAKARTFIVFGETVTIATLALVTGEKRKTIARRIWRGMTAEDAAFGMTGQQIRRRKSSRAKATAR